MPQPGELDQTPLSNVRLVPPTEELEETYISSLTLAHLLHYVKKRDDIIHKNISI